MFWRLTKKEIVEWLERKEREFARGGNRNPRMGDEQRLQRYVFTELHEIFFGKLPIILTKWLERLVKITERYRTAMPWNWTPELVRQLNFGSNKTSRAVDFWLNGILRDHITKFAVDCTQSYSVAERDFFKGSRERFMKALGTSINMLSFDKCVMTM